MSAAGDVRVGWWCWICCEHDLHEIKTAAELAEVLAEHAACIDDGWDAYEFAPTREAAMAAIGPGGWVANDP